ncbi:hypothetical protein [Pseudanabaena sp. PCC 6802]|uniref:hypothetical protein n=1 Tax=Pseudanabaena sp. PCC 6802 TaxID=118173 RepID=UPI0003487B9E|nr:hypothetical protein [Pseudanabaena sp. PCC 6802]
MPLNIKINFDQFNSPLFDKNTTDGGLARAAVVAAAAKWESYLTNEEFTNISVKESQSDTTNRQFKVVNPTNVGSNANFNFTPVTLSSDIDDILIYVGTEANNSLFNLGGTYVGVIPISASARPSFTTRLGGEQTYQPFISTISFKDLSSTPNKWWVDSTQSVDISQKVSVFDPVSNQTYSLNKYVDLYSIALHEIGHVLGYNDSPAYKAKLDLNNPPQRFFKVYDTTIKIPLSTKDLFHAADSGQLPYDLMSVDDAVVQVFTGGRFLAPSTDNLKVLASLGYKVSNSGVPINQAKGTLANDIFSSTSAADTLDALSGDDLVSGEDGDDVISGGLGNDTILGSNGNDKITGDKGQDILYGDYEYLGFSSLSGNDTINAGDENDSLYGGYGNDSLVGGDGDDYLDGGPGKDTIDGGKGNDTVKIDPNDPIVINVENRQAAAGSDGNDTLYGSKGDDIIRGGNDADRLEGLEGNDTLYGGGTKGETTSGSDTLLGGDGKDLLVANIAFAVTQKDLPSSAYTAGEDTLDGGIGNDTLLGGTNTADKTTMYGGDGNDTIVAQSGQAFMHGGIGNDSIRGGSNTTFNGNTANGNDGNDTIEAGTGGIAASGDAGDDVLIGNTARDYLWGNSGNDTLTAKSDYDTLDGGSGNDYLKADGNGNFLIGAEAFGTNPGAGEIDTLVSSTAGSTNFALGYSSVFWVGGGTTDYALIQGFKTGDSLQTLNLGSSYSATQAGANIDIAYNGDLIAILENYSNLDYIKRQLKIP